MKSFTLFTLVYASPIELLFEGIDPPDYVYFYTESGDKKPMDLEEYEQIEAMLADFNSQTTTPKSYRIETTSTTSTGTTSSTTTEVQATQSTTTRTTPTTSRSTTTSTTSSTFEQSGDGNEIIVTLDDAKAEKLITLVSEWPDSSSFLHTVTLSLLFISLLI